MPYRKLIIVLFLASSSVSALPNKVLSEVVIDDGRPFHVRNGEVELHFDGSNKLLVNTGNSKLRISARSPSRAFFSADRKFLALNFGNGSGQVYDLEIYELKSGKKNDLAPLKARLIRAAARRGCRAAPDAVSILFKKWAGNDNYVVETEDFSRARGCSSLAGKWKMRVGS